jgi:hypothetical protein
MSNATEYLTTTIRVRVGEIRNRAGDRVQVAHRRQGRTVGTIRADYQGGAYVELTFAPAEPGESVPFAPTEVINVWDYERGGATIPVTAEAVRAVVVEWANSHADESDPGDYWPDWFADYIDNARY